MPRKYLLTEEVQVLFCQGIRDGLTQAASAALAGVSGESVATWLERGRDAAEGDELYEDFVREVLRAEADIERIMLRPIMDSVAGLPVKAHQLKSAMYWLSSRRRAYMAKVNIEGEMEMFAAALAKFAPPDVERNVLAAITVASEQSG